MILNTVVVWLHVFGAIGWMGAGMAFAFVIGPSVGLMSPPARTEFFAKVVPKYLRFVEVFSILTIIFGVVSAVVFADGDYSIFSPSTTFGLLISTGAVLGLATIGLAMAVIVPTARKISAISQVLLQNPGPPPAELLVLAKRLRVSSTLALFVLIVVTMLMVGAATY
ncbi:MAG: hypothetical protein JRN09_04050 [Nitrososphaerota archaeon]|jgi:uncharacterized membrane protein|nr:hypothetical protein [Nitrososphaerota archaeon]